MLNYVYLLLFSVPQVENRSGFPSPSSITQPTAAVRAASTSSGRGTGSLSVWFCVTRCDTRSSWEMASEVTHDCALYDLFLEIINLLLLKISEFLQALPFFFYHHRAVLQYRRHARPGRGPLPVCGLLQGREDRPGIPLK